MSNSETNSQHNGPNLTVNLIDLLYYFPTSQEELKDYKKIDTLIRQIITTIKKLQRTSVDEIQRVCNTHKKLHVISKFLLHDKVSILVVNLFTHLMLSSKLLNYIVKLNVPLIIYKNMIRIIQRDCDRDKNRIRINQKDKEIEQSVKFIYEFCKIQPKKFPRFYANLISSILTQYSIQKNSQSIIFILVLDISIQILKNNFVLAAESQILQNIYNKVISGDLDIEKTKLVIDIIVNYCSSKQTRDIVHGCIDIGKVFARFNNVDSRHIKQGNQPSSNQEYEEKLIKSCIVIQTFLSSWPTLIYFIVEKTTLMNFVNGLARKTPLEIQIIKTHILKKIIIRTLTYNKYRMLNSLNMFGFKSNYLNYRGLVLINFLLKNDGLYETFESISNQGQLLQSLSSLCLEYFPHISENEKYSKKIIKNIKYPRHYETFIAKQAYKKKLQSYNEETLICLKSYCKPSLISYYFEPKQLRNYLIWLKQDKKIFQTFSQELMDEIQINLESVKQQSQSIEKHNKMDIFGILANFYKVGIQASRHIAWKGENLKFAKFLSSILQYLINNEYSAIFTILLRILKSLFERPKLKYCKFLICTVLDDFGKYLPNNEECQSAILNNYKNDDYAFLISKILLNIDYEKSTDKFNKAKFQGQLMSPKKILQRICTKEGSDYIILQIIEIIKKIYHENVEKNQPESTTLIEVISNNLIYHKNEQIVLSCLQFFEEIVMSKTGNFQKYIKMIKIDKIKMEHHKKRVAYMFLVFEGGFQSVTEVYPQLFKEELQNWLSKGSNMLKEYTNFLLKEVKRFNNIDNREKQNNFYFFLGFQEDERQSLINLPWNVMINDDCYAALAEYKTLKEKLKLRVRVAKVIQNQTTISLLNTGMNSFAKDSKQGTQNSSVTVIVIRLEQIMKSYEKNKSKQNKEQSGRFAVTKQQVTLFFSVDYNQNFILEKLNINIYLEKKIYRPLSYPYNFIYLLTMTKSGMDFLKKQKVYEKVIEKISSPQKNFDILKQNLILLGCYCSGQRQIKDSIDKKEFYEGLMKGFWKTFIETTNYEIKEICHWIMNVLIKDQDFQIKIKSEKQKKGKFVQTKYGGALYYYHYCPSQTLIKQQQEYDNLQFIRQEMPQKLYHEAEFKEIYEFLNNEVKQRELLNNKKIDTLKKTQYSNPKVFQNILKYMSLINYGCVKINIVFEMFKKYIASPKFDIDFPNGLPLP